MIAMERQRQDGPFFHFQALPVARSKPAAYKAMKPGSIELEQQHLEPSVYMDQSFLTRGVMEILLEPRNIYSLNP